MDLASLLIPMLSSTQGAQQPTPIMDPSQFQAMAQLQQDQQQYARNSALAQQMLSSQYTPNSGRLGVFSGLAKGLMGKMLQDKEDAKLSDILQRTFQEHNAVAQAQHDQQIRDQMFKTDEDIRKGKALAGMEYIPGVGYMDKNTGQITVNPNVSATEIATKKAEAENAAAASAKYREAPGAGEIAGLNAKLAQAKAMGATPEQLLAMVTGQSTANPETQVVGSMLVDKRTGKATPILDASGKPIPTGTDAKSNAVVEKSQEGLADNVLQYVATATHTDVDKLRSMTPDQVQALYKQKGGRDWGTAIASAIPGIGSYIVSKANPNLDAFATGAQANEARIQHPVGTIPYNAEVLARKSSIGPEKTDTFNAAFIKKALEDAQDTKPSSAVPAPTQTAINPQTGQRIGLVNGQWVPI